MMGLNWTGWNLLSCIGGGPGGCILLPGGPGGPAGLGGCGGGICGGCI